MMTTSRFFKIFVIALANAALHGAPLVQQGYIKASNPDTGDNFGRQVAVSGNTMVVGVPLESSNATGINGNEADDSAVGAGAAYVYVNDGSGWIKQAYLKPSNTGAGDNFGWSVAISGDTIIVGSLREDSSTTGVNSTSNNSATDSGAAYVFTRSGTTWTQQAYLKASNTGTTDLFGIWVGIAGDTAVVSARDEDTTATDSGAVYVFVRSGTTWSQQGGLLKASNAGASDRFGATVGISGDTIAIGAYGEDSAATGVGGSQASNTANAAGAAYVFTRSGTTWSQQAYLKASNTGADDFFGFTLAISGNTLVVGARDEDSAATGVGGSQSSNAAVDSGAAYVFTRSGTTWSQQAYLKASNTEAGDQFSAGISISGDTIVLSSSTEDSAAVGVNGNSADNTAPNAGAAYVFSRSGTTWGQSAYLKASNTDAGDGFGNGVAVSERYVVAGASLEDSAASGINGNEADDTLADAGAVYVFELETIYVWSGGGTTFNWSEGANWVGGFAPPNDGTKDIVFGASINYDTNLGYVTPVVDAPWAVNSILFGSGRTRGYFLSGSTLTVGSGGIEAKDFPGFWASLSNPITLTANQTWWQHSTTDSLGFTGQVSLNGHTLTVTSEYPGTGGAGVGLNCAITGVGNLVLNAGTNIYIQDQSHTYVGTTTCNSLGGNIHVYTVDAFPGEVVTGGYSSGLIFYAGHTNSRTISGTGGIAYNGNQTYIVTGNNSYSDKTNLGYSGTPQITVTSDTAFGTGSLAAWYDGASITADAPRTFANQLVFQHSPTKALTFSGAFPFTFTGGATVQGTARAVVTAPSLTIGGIVSDAYGTSHWTKEGVGTLVFGGTTANTFTGNTTVKAGALRLAKSTGIAAIPSGVLSVEPTASVTWAASNQVADGVNLAMTGGELSLEGRSETFGTLDVDGAATVDFATVSGSSAVAFANSSALNWSGILNIEGYMMNGTTSLRFGTSSAALTPAQLAKIRFQGGPISPAAVIDSAGFVIPAPDIYVEQPATMPLSHGETRSFGEIVAGGSSDLVFTIRNIGVAPLTLTGSPKVIVGGISTGAFTVTTQPDTTVNGGGIANTTFTVRFAPIEGGYKTATLTIPSDDPSTPGYVININGTGLSFNTDTDNDGLNDASEFQMAALGFNWQVSQPALVSTYQNAANGAGYYSLSQVQALHVGAPLIQKIPATGQFKLTLGLEKSTDMSNFSLYPFTAPQMTVNGQGKIEFLFTVPDDAAFFRLGAE